MLAATDAAHDPVQQSAASVHQHGAVADSTVETGHQQNALGSAMSQQQAVAVPKLELWGIAAPLAEPIAQTSAELQDMTSGQFYQDHGSVAYNAAMPDRLNWQDR